MSNTYSSKNKLAALLLCFFLGTFGLHRFYIGRTKGGILMLVLSILGAIFSGGIITALVSVWAIIDFVCLCLGNLTDAQGKPLKFGA